MNDQVAVVTGGAKGIGRAIVARLQSAGARVAVWDLEPAEADLAVEANVADEASVEGALRRTLETFGRVDILVNNAGVNGPTVPVWECSLADWDRVIAVDLTGVFLCSRAVVPHMRERGSGRIVTVASVVGKEGNANAAPYTAAKAGAIGLTKALAKDLVDSGVLVNCVCPAMTETDLLNQMTPDYIETVKSKIPMGRFCTVEEIADMVAWIAGPECTFTTGAVFDLSGGRATY